MSTLQRIMTRAPTVTCSSEDTVNPQTDIGWLLATSYHRLIQQADKLLSPLGLTAAQYGVVMMLARGEASTSSELCRLMEYDRGAMTRLLQRLESKELLTRSPDPADRRSQTLRLSRKGERLHEQGETVIDRLHGQALQELEPDEAKLLATLLCRVIHNLN